MTKETKYKISVGLNVLYIAIILAAFMVVYIDSNPFIKELGDGYYVYRGGKEIHREKTDWDIRCDAYLNYDEYILLRQNDGSDSNNDRYYLINKATDEIAGPLDYDAVLDHCTARGLMLI